MYMTVLGMLKGSSG